MAEQNNSLINIGELAEPAKVLIERISDAVGGIFKPYQITRIAQAEAEAEKIKTLSKIETSELEQRAFSRLLHEESLRQENIENITNKAIPNIDSSAQPQNIENDWLVDFFDKSRLTSDEEMQEIWARILAGETNSPGKFSKRTVHSIASLDKKDAQLFTKLCSYAWHIGTPTPLIFEVENRIYADNGINFTSLKHLDALGLISFESVAGYIRKGLNKTGVFLYQGRPALLELPNETGNTISTGHVMFTDIGLQLFSICNPEPVIGLYDYVLSEWEKSGIKRQLAG